LVKVNAEHAVSARKPPGWLQPHQGGASRSRSSLASVIHYVLAAPGGGKSTVAPHLRELLPRSVVLDWDAFMGPAQALAGVAIRQAPQTWAGYQRLVRTIVDQVWPVNTVLLGVCTPQQLSDWPNGEWLLLDCADDERRTRLAPRGNPAETEEAVVDAAWYRSLGLPALDSTDLEPREVAKAIARMIGPAFSPAAPTHFPSWE
jgi:hypothetical protein